MKVWVTALAVMLVTSFAHAGARIEDGIPCDDGFRPIQGRWPFGPVPDTRNCVSDGCTNEPPVELPPCKWKPIEFLSKPDRERER